MTSQAPPSRYQGLDLGVSSSPANSFISDISVLFLRGRGNWLPVSTWITLFEVLEIPPATARTALHRMTKAGFLERQLRDGRRGYSMSEAWIAFEAEAADDLTAPAKGSAEASQRWALVTLNIPESKRGERHAIRSVLGRNGFAPLGNGLWIGASGRLRVVRDALEGAALSEHVELFEADHVGFEDVASLVARCWDIDTIAERYRDLITALTKRLKSPPTESARSFAHVVRSNNEWRRANFADPDLPAYALPVNWPHDRAQTLMEDLLGRFLAPARAYVDSLVES